MSIRRIFRVCGNCIAEIVLLFALVSVGMCQTASDQEAESASSDTVDEITVYGSKSIIRLRHEFYSVEEDFFDMYNILNSNNDFDVDCDYVTFLGDRRRHHLCMPKFAEKDEANATADMMISGRWYDFSPQWT